MALIKAQSFVIHIPIIRQLNGRERIKISPFLFNIMWHMFFHAWRNTIWKDPYWGSLGMAQGMVWMEPSGEENFFT